MAREQTDIEGPGNMHDAVCQKCKKRESCRVVCYPVELILRGDSPVVYEQRRRDGITVHTGSTQMVHRSSLSSGADPSGYSPRRSDREAEAFSTENGNPFASYEPNHSQTSVFIKRFFGKWLYKDIAEAEGITPKAAHKLYYRACRRLVAVIIEMDSVDKMTDEERKAANVAKQKRYLERHRDRVNARRRAHYRKHKERINAKRRASYVVKKSPIDIKTRI